MDNDVLMLIIGGLVAYIFHLLGKIANMQMRSTFLLHGLITKQIDIKLDANGDIEIIKGENYAGN